MLCLGVSMAALVGGVGISQPVSAANASNSVVSTKPAVTATGKVERGQAEEGKEGQGRVASPAGAVRPSVSPQKFEIDDFAIEGGNSLSQIEIEEAVYPFLGPNKTVEDVEKARAALEKAYHDKGFQTVSVSIPEQNSQRKVITLKVVELKVGRLRVKNSRYFDLERIKTRAESLKEGVVPNFNDVTKDIVALNQWPDRRVTPALRAGVTPGTVDVDLNVEDTAPIHASVEYNNRQSPSTTATRFIGTVRYDNLWQLGHSASFIYQVAPERPDDAKVFSGSYLARIPGVEWLSFLAYGVKSSSSVATVGGANIVGPGEIVGSRAIITLPPRDRFFHSLSVGLDYKHFQQTVTLGSGGFSSPVTYYPLLASYGSTFQGEKFTTQFNASITYNMRPISSDWEAFDAKRYYASASFTHFNADVSHTQELPEGFQLWGKVQGQIADGPLVSSEQFSAGGFDTVRGYLESEVLGDNGVAGNIELRSPNIGQLLQSHVKDETGLGAPRFTTFNDWRFFAFADGARAETLKPLPDQQSHFNLWSYGVGTRFKLFNYVNGVVAYSVPMVTQAYTRANDPRFNFRIWGEF